MLLDPIFQRVDESVSHATRGASRFIVITVLSLLALGFATAALWAYAVDAWGRIGGNLAIAVFFVLVALAATLLTGKAAPQAIAATGPEPEAKPLLALDQPFIEGELIKSLTAMAPSAAKSIMDRVPQNLHLIIGAALGLAIASKLAEKLDTARNREA